jgi:hypothetical protein
LDFIKSQGTVSIAERLLASQVGICLAKLFFGIAVFTSYYDAISTYTIFRRFFGFSVCTQSVGVLGRGISPPQGRYLHAEQHKHRINVHRHPCLEWDSNPRSQCSSERRQLMHLTARPLCGIIIWTSFLPSFSPTLQFRVTFSLLNNLPPFFSIPRLTAWFLNNLVLWREVVSLIPNPQTGGPGYPSSSGSYPLTCPAWVTLPVTTLPPA